VEVREERLLAASEPAREAHRQGERALALGDYRDAARGFATAARLEPRSALALLNLGLAQWRLGRRAQAIDTVAAALARQPRWAAARVHMAHLLAEENRLQEAAAAARRAAELAPRLPDAWLARAHVALLQDDPRGSERFARRATALAPRAAVPWLALGDALARTPGAAHLPEAIDAFQRAAEIEPTPYALRQLGQAQRRAGRLAAAVGSLRQAAQRDPRDPAAAYQLALALRAAGQESEADRWAERSRRLQEARYRLAEISRRAEQAPGDARLQERLAVELRRQGDRDGAMRAYRRVLALEPDNGAARRALAGLEAGVGR
jgi:tetratricopeptide (TPR) repeat protein